MTTVKRITDLTRYTGVLPFASELLGTYQPMIGWKSKRMLGRFSAGLTRDTARALEALGRAFVPTATVNADGVANIAVGVLPTAARRGYDRFLLEFLSTKLPKILPTKLAEWEAILNPGSVQVAYDKSVENRYSEIFRDRNPRNGKLDVVHRWVEERIRTESQIGAALLLLVHRGEIDVLKTLFYVERNEKQLDGLIKALKRTLADSVPGGLDPTDPKQLASGVVSPVGIVHLYRQYFFELDTFLGTPVHHVWLAPGASVELFEIHTRREVVERSIESAIDTTRSTERITSTNDEFSDNLAEQRSQDLSLGASVTASYASISATATFDLNNTQEASKEVQHKQTREQSDKIAAQIRQSFKSTFKSTTEFTDTSSVKHVFENKTNPPQLLNYELRRKMRQVAVQVQDIGSYLSWQTYVDNPGRDLGLAQLIHIAKPASFDSIPDPELIPRHEPFVEPRQISIPFVSVLNGADNRGETYRDGNEVENTEFRGDFERIEANFPQSVIPPKADHTLLSIEYGSPSGGALILSTRDLKKKSATEDVWEFTIHLDLASFDGLPSIQVPMNLHWTPNGNANATIDQENKAREAKRDSAKRLLAEQAFVAAAQERITAVSKLTPRKDYELREEERIVIYRRLIQEMLMSERQLTIPDDKTRHFVAEVINSIFDVEKMLYYVAPEWWKPRNAASQHITPPIPVEAPQVSLTSSSVDWGGVAEVGRPNYKITENSVPTKLGSSLGWVMQLDGDNMRNAFLNAPWVKAVIPIRPGKEKAALEWLNSVEVEGTEGLDAQYQGPDSEVTVGGVKYNTLTLKEVLDDVAERVKRKHEASGAVKQFTLSDDSSVFATPVDRVFEHGFDSLQGGFKAPTADDDQFAVFDQWLEILPTDQIVPVEVKYDPITGRQISID